MLRVASLALILASTALAAAPDAGRKPRIAVLYFEGLTKDEDVQVLAKGYAELLINDLLATGAVDVIERTRLEELITELKLGESRFANKESFAKVGDLLGADYLVTGSFVKVGKNKYMIAPRLKVVQTGVFVQLKNVVLDVEDVLEGEQKLVGDMASALQAQGPLKDLQPPPKRGHTLSLDATMKYSKALDAKDKKDKATQKKLLAEVLQAQPEFKLAQADLLSLRD
jgi:TolB-like protein